VFAVLTTLIVVRAVGFARDTAHTLPWPEPCMRRIDG